MVDFTSTEIEDAQREPRVGDRWQDGDVEMVVIELARHMDYIVYTENGRKYGASRKEWASWTRNATLVKRGDV